MFSVYQSLKALYHLRLSKLWVSWRTFWVSLMATSSLLSSPSCPPSGALLNPGTEPGSPVLQVDSLLSEPPPPPTVCMPSHVHGVAKSQTRLSLHIVVGGGGSDIKESTYNMGDMGSIPGLGRSPEGGHGREHFGEESRLLPVYSWKSWRVHGEWLNMAILVSSGG